MQIGQAQIVRSNWYDRNRTLTVNYSRSVRAPSAVTGIDSYIAPANRAAEIYLNLLSIKRLTAPTVVGATVLYFDYGDVVPAYTSLATVELLFNTVGEEQTITPGLIAVLAPGERVRTQYAGTDTDGTSVIITSYSILEYDA